ERRLLAPLDFAEQILGGLLAHPLELDERIEVQMVEIREVLDELRLDELMHELVAEPVDVHGVLAGEVADSAFELGRTGDVDAAVVDAAFLALNVPATARTGARHPERAFLASPPFRKRPEHVRDDVARALDKHLVADADILALDLVHVVE